MNEFKMPTLVWEIPENLVDVCQGENANYWAFYQPDKHRILFKNILSRRDRFFSFFDSKNYLTSDIQFKNDNIIFLGIESMFDPIFGQIISTLKKTSNFFLVKDQLKNELFNNEIIINDFDLKLDCYDIYKVYGGKLMFTTDELKSERVQQELDNKLDIFFNNCPKGTKSQKNIPFSPLFKNENFFSFDYLKVFENENQFETFYHITKNFITTTFGVESGSHISDINESKICLNVALRFEDIENKKVSIPSSPWAAEELISYFKSVLYEKIRFSEYLSECNNDNFTPDTTYEDNLTAFEGDLDAYNSWQNE